MSGHYAHPRQEKLLPGSQDFPVPEQNLPVGHEINLESQGYRFFYKKLGENRAPKMVRT